MNNASIQTSWDELIDLCKTLYDEHNPHYNDYNMFTTNNVFMKNFEHHKNINTPCTQSNLNLIMDSCIAELTNEDGFRNNGYIIELSDASSQVNIKSLMQSLAYNKYNVESQFCSAFFPRTRFFAFKEMLFMYAFLLKLNSKYDYNVKILSDDELGFSLTQELKNNFILTCDDGNFEALQYMVSEYKSLLSLYDDMNAYDVNNIDARHDVYKYCKTQFSDTDMLHDYITQYNCIMNMNQNEIEDIHNQINDVLNKMFTNMPPNIDTSITTFYHYYDYIMNDSTIHNKEMLNAFMLHVITLANDMLHLEYDIFISFKTSYIPIIFDHIINGYPDEFTAQRLLLI